MYANTFEPYRQFYQENESLDLEAIRKEEHGMATMTLIVSLRASPGSGRSLPLPLTPHPCGKLEKNVGACSQAMH